MKLNDLRPNLGGGTRPKKRLGRGIGSWPWQNIRQRT